MKASPAEKAVMPPAMLMDLDRPMMKARESVGRLNAYWEQKEQAGNRFRAEALQAAKEMAGSSHVVRKNWQGFCRIAADGMAEQVHGLRDTYLQWMAGYLEAMRTVHRHAREADAVAPQVGALQADIEAVEKLHRRLSERWTDLEGFEELAAQDFHLPNSVLLELAKKYPPPPEAWDDE